MLTSVDSVQLMIHLLGLKKAVTDYPLLNQSGALTVLLHLMPHGTNASKHLVAEILTKWTLLLPENKDLPEQLDTIQTVIKNNMPTDTEHHMGTIQLHI